MNFKLIAFIFMLCHSILAYNNDVDNFEITCKDENGENVDWFYMYKLPERFGQGKESKGQEYVFMTSKFSEFKWILSNQTVNQPDSIVGHTLSQAYFDATNLSEDRFLVAYNDEPPNHKPNGRKGHLKGVFVGDEKSGFWLIHSVPLYPNITDDFHDYDYPKTGTTYGQSFLCLSLKSSQLDSVATQLIFNQPQIFQTKSTENLNQKYTMVKKLIENSAISNGPYWNEVTLMTINGDEFKSFAKSSEFSKELYEDWVAPILNTDLYVETWRKGPGNFPSNCTKTTRVWNISKLKINNQFEFHTTEDHSKWGVSDEHSNWICVGDINRAEKQTHRGGGTVCRQHSEISKSYRALIEDFEPCQKSDDNFQKELEIEFNIIIENEH